jgi:hypothetical protein
MTLLRIGLYFLAACGAVTLLVGIGGWIILARRVHRAHRQPPGATPAETPPTPPAMRPAPSPWPAAVNLYTLDPDATQFIPRTPIPPDQKRAQ